MEVKFFETEGGAIFRVSDVRFAEQVADYAEVTLDCLLLPIGISSSDYERLKKLLLEADKDNV